MKYNIIYADPPWQYDDKCHSGKRGYEYKHKAMSMEEIKALPVNNLTDENCVLFMWVTWPFLQEGLDTIKAWGFKYKTIGFVWIKLNKIAQTLFWGMGNWTRSNSEICLFAIKGKPHRINKGVHSIILHGVLKPHSRKPDEVRQRIVNLMGDLPRVELFATEKINGWDCWGDEVGSDIDIERGEKIERIGTKNKSCA